MSRLIPCIIAGGAGTRLWPVSRASLPKPFMQLADGQSLLQKAFLRAAALPGVERLLTVTQRELFFRTLDDYRPLNDDERALDFILEPSARNTAPALAAAALQISEQQGPDCLLLILPADHLIEDTAAFAAAVERARHLAEQGWLVTFGMQPTRAETGFGYIEQGEALAEGAFQVRRFVEKPGQAQADAFLLGGQHLWNNGMFCLRADTLLAELQQHAPQLLATVSACLQQSNHLSDAHGQHCELDSPLFAAAPDISIDYAVLEHSTRVAVLPCAMGWSDIGSWQAWRTLSPADSQGNQTHGEVLLHEVANCYIDSPHRLIGAVGVQDLIVVDTPDALLIADARRSQDVRHIVQQLKQRDHETYRLHRTAQRPWGYYSVIEQGPHYKIKRLVVLPGASLSHQLHQQRSEHWIVVSGMAQVTNGEREFLLNSNESTFIPAGHSHRLSNPGASELVIIEVQSGAYLGEDDIVRLADAYGRVAPSDLPGAMQ